MTQPASAPRALAGTVAGSPVSLSLRDGQLVVTHAHTHAVRLSVPVELVLDAAVVPDNDGGVLSAQLLAPPKRPLHSSLACIASRKHYPGARVLTAEQWQQREGADRLELVQLDACLGTDAQAEAPHFVEQLLACAYPHTEPYRRVLVICNPMGGQGRGRRVLREKVEPVLRAARCHIQVQETQKKAHAYTLAYEAHLDNVDVIVCIGGDGTAHEIINALVARPDADRALRVPLALVPCGSGNGAFVSAFGPKVGFNSELACLGAVKGRSHSRELCALTQPLELHTSMNHPVPYQTVNTASGQCALVYTFLSQSIGLMADVDLGTESLRFLGDLRFTLGYVYGVLRNRPCDIDVDVVLGENGSLHTRAMHDRAVRARASSPPAPAQAAEPTALRYGTVRDALPQDRAVLKLPATMEQLEACEAQHRSDWIRLNVHVSSLYGGKLPFVARTLMAFPYVLPCDGALDVMVQRTDASCKDKLDAMIASEHGRHVHADTIDYLKVEALRVSPQSKTPNNHSRYLSVDGEMLPFGPFQVEVCQRQWHLVSLEDDEWRSPALAPRPPTA